MDVEALPQHVYAVVRVDLPDSRAVDEISADPALWITIKEIVPTNEEAATEVERLNALNADKGCIYFAQLTRFFPDGRAVQAQVVSMCVALALTFIGGAVMVLALVHYASPDQWYKVDGPRELFSGLWARRWYVAAAVALMAASVMALETAC